MLALGGLFAVVNLQAPLHNFTNAPTHHMEKRLRHAAIHALHTAEPFFMICNRSSLYLQSSATNNGSRQVLPVHVHISQT